MAAGKWIKRRYGRDGRLYRVGRRGRLSRQRMRVLKKHIQQAERFWGSGRMMFVRARALPMRPASPTGVDSHEFEEYLAAVGGFLGEAEAAAGDIAGASLEPLAREFGSKETP